MLHSSASFSTSFSFSNTVMRREGPSAFIDNLRIGSGHTYGVNQYIVLDSLSLSRMYSSTNTSIMKCSANVNSYFENRGEF